MSNFQRPIEFMVKKIKPIFIFGEDEWVHSRLLICTNKALETASIASEIVLILGIHVPLPRQYAEGDMC